MMGGAAFDDYQTVRGLRQCPWLMEGNDWMVGRHPSAAALAGRDLITLGAVTAFNLFFGKKLSSWISVGPGTAYTVRRVQAGLTWQRYCPWL